MSRGVFVIITIIFWIIAIKHLKKKYRIYPRATLDIAYLDILFAFYYSLFYSFSSSSSSSSYNQIRSKIETFWSSTSNSTFPTSSSQINPTSSSTFPTSSSQINPGLFYKDGIALLSVRTAFDLYLKVLRLKEGMEVIVSAINIPDMIKIIREYKLVPVPVDMDMKTLEMKLDQFENAFSENTGLVLVAHLHGSRMQYIDQILEISHRNGIPVFEDCAEC